MCTPTSLPVFRYNNSGDFLQVQDKIGLINTIMLLSGNLCQQKSWRSLVLPPSWSRQRCGKAPMLTTALKRSPQVVQRNSFKTFEDIVFFSFYIFGLLMKVVKKIHSSFSDLETGCSRPSLAAAIFSLALLKASSTVFTLEKSVAELSRSIKNFLLSRRPLPLGLSPTRNAFAWTEWT